MNLMEQFADPELIQGLPLAGKMAGAGITAVMGMGVTFTVLLFLWGSIAIMMRVMHRNKTSHGESGKAAVEHELQELQTTVSKSQAKSCHIAVIAAAVAAYEGSGSSLIIRKIQRLPVRSAWSGNIAERKVSR